MREKRERRARISSFSCDEKMQKIKPLAPTLREKKRYLVYESLDREIEQEDLIRDIKSTLGVFDAAEAGILGVDVDGANGILRLANQGLDKVRAAIALLDHPVQTLGVSGTLKNAREIYEEARSQSMRNKQNEIHGGKR